MDLFGNDKNKNTGKKYQCQICNRVYSQKSNLTKHIKSVHEDKKYKYEMRSRCKISNKEYSSYGSLIYRHMRSVHEGVKYHAKNVIIKQLIRVISLHT